MINKSNIRENKELTEAGKKIFGNVLVRIYNHAYDYGSEDKNTEALNKCNVIIGKDGDLYNGAEDIILEFSNGSLVSISNSEWGCISKYETS